MLLDVCLGTKSVWRLLFVLSEAPGKAVARKQIQKLTKLGNKMLTKFLLVLDKFEIIITKKIGKSYYYKLNLANPFVEQILELIQLEKKKLNNPDFSTLILLREFVYELTNFNFANLKQVILFGSHAKRTSHVNSDIDIAIILKQKKVDDELLITNAIEKLRNRFDLEIQPHYYTEHEFKSSKSKLIKEIIKDGVKLL